MILYRRRSLIIKVLVFIPVSWLLVTVVLSVTDRFQKETIEVINGHLESNNIETEVIEKYEGRKPRQSLEDNNNNNKIQDSGNQNQEQGGIPGVIPAPREPEGLGELGKPVRPTNLTEEQQKLVKQGWEKNAFNQYVSDMISLHRSLPDVRGKGAVTS